MIGKTLGHYHVIEQLGRGGMGEVYQAKDQKLGRDVAIKVLPEEFAKDADRVARFQREAKLLASLNHPNIAAIYGLEESGSTHFLVLELIEGETLADRLTHGAIPVEESLNLALQITEALEAAHEKGVIHRDLKPANIKVTPDGKVKVLDFGLAKAFARESEDMNLSNSPTLSVAATQQGVILGTAAYMSPEQARGKPVDKRADIWAFGVVLFEMLTGRSVFSGNDVSQTLARVLERQPDFSSLPAKLHPKIIEMLDRCLEKNPKNRYHDIADSRLDIQKVLADPSGVFVQPVVAEKPQKKLRVELPLFAVAAILCVLIGGVVVWLIKPTPPPEPKRVMRFEYELPEDQRLRILGSKSVLAISPDGSQFVYGTTKGLYIRSMNELEATHIPGSDEISQAPFFSPDGKWIGYWSESDNQLKKIAVSGGTPIPLTNDPSVGYLSWNLHNKIIYGYGENIHQISADGGNPEPLIELEGYLIESPQMLPDEKSVLFSRDSITTLEIELYSLKSKISRVLKKGGTNPRYLKTGHIVYIKDNNLFGFSFDINTLEVGGAFPLIKDVAIPSYAISDSGTLIYLSQSADATNRRLVWVDRKGREEPLAAPPDAYSSFRISPDGTKVALTVESDGRGDIRIYDFQSENITSLTFDKADDYDPIWTSDGERVFFASSREGEQGSVYWKSANGTGEIQQVISEPNEYISPSCFSSDGKTMLIRETGKMGNDIAIMSLEGDRAKSILLQEKYDESDPQISPDGRWMAYTSAEHGPNEVFVCSFPDVSKGNWKVSTDGGNSPLWSPNGRELFYRNGDAVMAVAVETKPTFKHEKPKQLFSGAFYSTSFLQILSARWDISPDGQRFLMIKELESPRKIHIVLNWFEELKERVPVD